MRLRTIGPVAALFAVAAFAQDAGKANNDWLIVPGLRAGPITSATTRADLVRIFGSTNVVDQDVTVSDGGPEPGTVLLGANAGESTVILWTRDKPEKRVAVLFFCMAQESSPDRAPAPCQWHTKERISLGTTLIQLEQLNGRAFDLSGFGWDYEGSISSWRGGNLSQLKATCGEVGLRLFPHLQEPPVASEQALLKEVEGDETFASNLQAMETLNPGVGVMLMSFAECASHPE